MKPMYYKCGMRVAFADLAMRDAWMFRVAAWLQRRAANACFKVGRPDF
jgi:hypothetical protein